MDDNIRPCKFHMRAWDLQIGGLVEVMEWQKFSTCYLIEEKYEKHLILP